MYIKSNLSVVQPIENEEQNRELTYCFHRVRSNVRRQHEQLRLQLYSFNFNLHIHDSFHPCIGEPNRGGGRDTQI